MEWKFGHVHPRDLECGFVLVDYFTPGSSQLSKPAAVSEPLNVGLLPEAGTLATINPLKLEEQVLSILFIFLLSPLILHLSIVPFHSPSVPSHPLHAVNHFPVS